MMKKLIGIVVALAVIVVIVVAVLHHDRYRSMISFGAPETAAAAVATPIETSPLVPAVELPTAACADSVALHTADSVAR